MDIQAAAAKTYCNVLALQKGLDPAGSAGHFEDAILLEVPLPWKKNIYTEPGALPPQMIDLLEKWLKVYREGGGYPHRPLMIAPDPEYSVTGFRRLMFYERPRGMMARFRKSEYLVPEAEVGAFIWSLYEAREQLSRFEHYRQPQHDNIRDILVCTHGTVDSACAKFGFPLYNLLRRQYADQSLRAWRVSHFGGHVFAPTLMDMPTGHYWAYVEGEQARQIIERAGDVSAMRGHYRGWAAFDDGFRQAAEREIWQRVGWRWFDYFKAGMLLTQDEGEDPRWAEVRIDYTSPDGSDSGAYEFRVEVGQHIETIHSTGSSATYNYPQYIVTAVREIAPDDAYATV
jgi:hypothetical protein